MLLGEDEFFGEGKSDKIPDLYDGNVPPKKNRLPSHCARSGVLTLLVGTVRICQITWLNG